ncbi:MAG: GNAT family N-acetyltransferase [Dokdonella sp.]|uniref:GNAT family N-acetyltransferase n=1 Tax=Dokdonella sp. TaxID=2291710 RepID=UPI003267F46F
MDANSPALPLLELDCGIARLRPWRPDDLDSLVEHASNANVSRGLADRFPYPYTGSDGRAWLARAVNESDRSWAVEIDGAAVGGVSLHPGKDERRYSAELGYWLGQMLWGRGIMTSVVACFADHAMADFQLHRLFASVYSSNPASARVLEKAGFEREGVQRSAIVKRGELLDLQVYARVRTQL